MFYKNKETGIIYFYVGKMHGGNYALADKNNDIVTVPTENMSAEYERMPDACNSFNYEPPAPKKKLEIKYGGPTFTRVIGSQVVDCDKIDGGPDLYSSLKQLINSWSLEIYDQNKNLTIEPANFLLVFCGSKYNVSKRQIREFLED